MSRWREDGARAGLLLLAMGALTWVLYGRAITWTFVADDLTNLHFVRTYAGSAWDFWIPGRAFGAPVTQSRYMPLHVAHWWAADRMFGDAVWAWHASSFALHTVVATLTGLVARVAFGAGWMGAAATATLFAASRVHAQAVVWVSVQFRLLATALLLVALLLALARRPRIVGAVAAFAAGLLLNPDLVVGPVAFGGFAWVAARAGDRERARRLMMIAACAGALVLAFAVANAITAARHPDTFALSWPQPQRLATFVANMVLPFDVPVVAKLIACVACAALLVRHREPATLPLVVTAIASAVLWSAATYDLAPRYLYLPSAFATIAIVRAGANLRPVVAWAAMSSLVVVSAGAVVLQDLPRFAYLPILPARLMGLAQTAPGARVAIVPDCPLPDADLAFFATRLMFVADPARATHVVDTGVESFRARYGEAFGARYWELPWLDP